MSERTLARKLSDEGLNFTEILQELRRDLAVRYLDDRKLHVSKIAWLLGFHEVSAFTPCIQALDWKDAEPEADSRRLLREVPRPLPVTVTVADPLLRRGRARAAGQAADRWVLGAATPSA
jgi:AraC-like DNA-binding protein